MSIADLKIGTRIAAGFGIVLACMTLVLGLALASFGQLNRADELNQQGQDRMSVGDALLLSVVNMETGLRGYVGSSKDNFLEPYHQGRKLFDESLARARELCAGDEAQLQRLQTMQASEQQFVKVAENLIKMRRDATELMSGTQELEAAFSRGEDKQASDRVRQAAGEFLQAERGQVDERHARMQSLRDGTRWALVGGGLFALVFGGALAWWLRRSIAGPLAEAVRASQRVAAGDLTVALAAAERGRKDEIGDLLEALHAMQASLIATVGHVRRNAESVATASVQIAQGNGELSRRTEQQAASLQQAAASMEQIKQTVGHNSDSAGQANRLAVDATQVATEGGAVVGQVVATMKGINESSRKIAEIIGTIDGIAFQTNILALNAAVEAARAGEQGRGFAVVAGEVRTLAQRAAEAAREIKQLIGVSVERVEQGNALVDRAGTTMQAVVDAIKRVSQIVGEISSASRDQTSGITQVSGAVSAMDQATQQNAALVEESAAAAESLSSQARQLVEAVSVFRIDEARA